MVSRFEIGAMVVVVGSIELLATGSVGTEQDFVAHFFLVDKR